MLNHPSPPRSVVSRITAILSTFLTGDSHSITEIARMTGLPLSTTHRLTADLAAWQLLYRAPDGLYRIGSTVQQLGSDVISAPALKERAPQIVTDLCEATGMRARFGVLADGRVAYIEKRLDPEPVTSFSRSATLPAHASAAGKAILAFAPSSTVAWVAQHLTVFTSRTLDTPDRLHRALGIVRLTHTAVAHGELTPGQRAAAAPVFGCGGAAVAALELELPDLPTDLVVAKAALAVAARGLSRELTADRAPSDRLRLRLVPEPFAASPAAGG
ncbi:MAG: hypothetical protein QOG20_563 [Pseudonocardiales bacterium]|nr:hypothetical protein [Pseudonocardiales bacterium]